MPAIIGQKKTFFIKFRVSPAAHQVAKQEADRRGMSVDELAQIRFQAALLDKQKAAPRESEAA